MKQYCTDRRIDECCSSICCIYDGYNSNIYHLGNHAQQTIHMIIPCWQRYLKMERDKETCYRKRKDKGTGYRHQSDYTNISPITLVHTETRYHKGLNPSEIYWHLCNLTWNHGKLVSLLWILSEFSLSSIEINLCLNIAGHLTIYNSLIAFDRLSTCKLFNVS